MSSNEVATNTLARLLAEEEFDDLTFVDLTHDSLDLRGKRFSNCTFEGMNLRAVQLLECVFTECRFVRCDLSMARLSDCSLRDVTFEHGKPQPIPEWPQPIPEWRAAKRPPFARPSKYLKTRHSMQA